MRFWRRLALAGAIGIGMATPAAAAGPFCEGLIRAVRAEAGDAEAVFLHSYRPGDFEKELPPVLSTTAFVYDNALAAIALIGCDDVRDAQRIGRALLRAARTDRTFHDGRIRNAYRAGPVGDGAPFLPGWWDEKADHWAEDPTLDGTTTGNVAWAALALLALAEASDDNAEFRDDAARLIDFVAEHTSCGEGFFCGGFYGYDPEQQRLPWISTEHNVDVAAAATRLQRTPGFERFLSVAEQARGALEHAFQGDHFAIGITPDGTAASPNQIVLDVQLWPWMALPDAPVEWREALTFAAAHLAVDYGFDFNSDRDGVWNEGTAQAALGYLVQGNAARRDELLKAIDGDRTPSGLVLATRLDRLSTGLAVAPNSKDADFFYRRRPHLGATAWAALAEQGFNPFTGLNVR